MFIAKNLKRLRLDRGLTQEELAEHIGVSGQAVSKWERDECYPDIVLLPGLANFFGVTVDYLLGMEEISEKEKLNNIYPRINELYEQKNYEEAVELIESMLKIFPSHPILLGCLGDTFARMGIETERAIQLCEQGLEGRSYKAKGTLYTILCMLHKRNGEIQKAEKLARSLPHTCESRELLLPNFLKQPERDNYLREHLPGILETICILIDDNIDIPEQIYSKPENFDPTEACEKIKAFLQ